MIGVDGDYEEEEGEDRGEEAWDEHVVVLEFVVEVSWCLGMVVLCSGFAGLIACFCLEGDLESCC